MDTIRSAVAEDSDNVYAFDTQDIRRTDIAHIPNLSLKGSPEQFVIAERA